MADRSKMSAAVTVSLATAAERRLIEGLMQFYIYDFSEMEPPGSTDFEIDDHGRFAPYPDLDDYWRRVGFHPLLIRVGAHVAGFALINTHSHQGGEAERNMGEFFIARKHRRAGAATRAVAQILADYPGRWEIAVAERNAAAKAFWQRAIACAANVADLTLVVGDGEHWRGPIWCFAAADPAN